MRAIQKVQESCAFFLAMTSNTYARTKRKKAKRRRQRKSHPFSWIQDCSKDLDLCKVSFYFFPWQITIFHHLGEDNLDFVSFFSPKHCMDFCVANPRKHQRCKGENKTSFAWLAHLQSKMTSASGKPFALSFTKTEVSKIPSRKCFFCPKMCAVLISLGP